MVDKQRIAVVTGAGRGIGRSIAHTLSASGCHVICVSRSDNARHVAEEIVSLGGFADAMQVDVSDAHAVKSACEHILDKYASVDILINNAGITRDNLLLRMSEEEWSSVLDTNLSSCFYWTRYLLRAMTQQRWGRIVNISSVVGKMGNFGQANYAAAKSGMIGFSKSVAKEVASRGVTVNVIAPGFITSDMTASLPEKIVHDLKQLIPMKDMGTVEDIAYAVEFLCSDKARYITGEVLAVDGGMSM